MAAKVKADRDDGLDYCNACDHVRDEHPHGNACAEGDCDCIEFIPEVADQKED